MSITRNGRMDHVSSNLVEPSIWVAWTFVRRRYLYAKNAIATKISTVITIDTTLMNQYRASIWAPSFDANSGSNCSCERTSESAHMLRFLPLFPHAVSLFFSHE